MSTFPSQNFALPDPEQDLPAPIRAASVDSFIKANRKATPQSVLEQRSSPRYSISDINAMDIDQVRERFAKTKFDDRGPVTRFLDMIDVPRNFIAGRILGNSIRRRKEAEGETGAFGEGKVYTSDLLNDMGVSNRVIRGVAGFIGDVALDPLTYAGPAGWGAKAAGTGGKVAVWTKRATKAISEGAEAFREGRAAAHPIVNEIIQNPILKAMHPDEAGEYLQGVIKPKGNIGKVKAAITGEPIEGAASGLVDDLHAPITSNTHPDRAALQDAVKRLYAEGGRQAAPGIRIGWDVNTGQFGAELAGYGAGRIRAGTNLMHVPWTDYGLFVPEFTPRAQGSILGTVASQARKYAGDPTKEITPDLQAFRDAANQVNNRVNQVHQAVEKIDAIDQEHSALRSGATAIDPTTGMVVPTADRLRALDLEREGWHSHATGMASDIATHPSGLSSMNGPVLQRLRAAEAAIKANPIHDGNTMLYASRVADAQEEAAKAAFWDHKLAEGPMKHAVEMRKGLMGSFEDRVNARVNTAMQTYGPHANYNQIRDIITQDEYPKFAATLKPNEAEIFGMSPEGADLMGKMADSLHAKMDANLRLAAATRAPLVSTMSAKDKAMAASAKVLLGWGHEDLGTEHLFAPMSTALSTLFDKADTIAKFHGTAAKVGQDVENALGGVRSVLRRNFGVQSGTTYQILRAVERSKHIAGNAAAREIGGSIVRDVRELGLSAENEDKARRLLSALAMERRLPVQDLAENPEAVRILADARKGGLLDNVVHPGLYQKLNDLSDKYGAMLEDVFRTDQESDPTLKGLKGYWPNVVTARAKAGIAATQKALGLSAPRQARMTGEITEAFEKHRASLKHVFEKEVVDPVTGAKSMKKYSFTDGQRVLAGYDKHEIEAMDPVAQRHVNNIKEAVAEYDKLPLHERPAPISVGPLDLNSQPGMNWLTGGVPLMEDDAAVALGQRFAQSEKAYLRSYLKDYADSRALMIENKSIEKVLGQTGNGAIVRLMGGAEARVEKRGQDIILHVGGERFRKPNIQPGEFNPLGEDRVGVNKFFPEALADAMERSNGAFKTETDVDKLIRAANMASKFWKQVTLLHPSWTLTDIVGNLILIANMGLDPIKVVKHLVGGGARIALAHNRGDAETLDAIKTTLRGIDISGADLARQAGTGVLGAGQPGDAAMHTLSNGARIGPLRYNPITNPKQAFQELWGNAVRAAQADSQASVLAKTKPMQTMKAMKNMVLDEGWARRVWRPWLMSNAVANDSLRMAAFMTLIDEGHDAQSAAREVSSKMLDMATLSPTEHKLRALVPFYAWTKASGVFGLRMLMENPKYFSAAPELKHNLEEALNGEANVPPHLRPRWLRDMQALQIGTDPDNRRSLLLTQSLPNEAAMYMAELAGSPALGMESFMNGLQYFGNTLGPPWRNLAELASGKEWYTGRTISSNENEGDLTPTEYLANQIRPLHELGFGNVRQGPVQQAFGRSVGEGLARLTIGGKLQPTDQKRMDFQNDREAKTIEQGLRKRVALAEREGDHETSLRARALLLRLYQSMRQKGLHTPKSLTAQLDQVSR